MKKIHSDKLKNDFPKIFPETFYGFECNDGWYNSIETLCTTIQRYIDEETTTTVPQVVAEQVKEKYGSLRFYASGGDNLTASLILKMEEKTENICEECGSTDRAYRRNCGGWISVKCNSCYEAGHDQWA